MTTALKHTHAHAQHKDTTSCIPLKDIDMGEEGDWPVINCKIVEASRHDFQTGVTHTIRAFERGRIGSE